jgi:hypothetical protein
LSGRLPLSSVIVLVKDLKVFPSYQLLLHGRSVGQLGAEIAAAITVNTLGFSFKSLAYHLNDINTCGDSGVPRAYME